MKKFILTILFALAIHINAAEAITRLPVSREWKSVGFGGGGTFIDITPDPEISGKVYMTSDVSGFLVSNDGAENWQFSNVGITTIIERAFMQSKFNPAIMYIYGTKLVRSTDRGRTWKEISTMSQPNTYKGFKIIAIDEVDPLQVFVGRSTGVIMRATDGVTFSEYATPFGTNIAISFLAISRDSRYLLAGSIASGMVRYDLQTGDATPISLPGTNGLRNWDYSKYVKDDVEYICVGGGWHITCSNDFFISNQTDTTDVTDQSIFFVAKIATTVLTNGNVRMIAYGRRTNTAGGANIAVVSDDGGVTWTSFWTNVTANYINNPSNEAGDFGSFGNAYSFKFDPLNEDIVYGTTDWRAWKSIDGGRNWNEMDKDAQNIVLSDVKVSPNGWWWICGMDVGLYYSMDKGETWNEAIPNTSVFDPQGFAIAGHWWRMAFTGTEEDWANGNGVVLVTWSGYITQPVYIPSVWRSNTNGIGNWVNSSTGLPTVILNGTAAPHKALWGIGYPRGLACHPTGVTCYFTVDGYSTTGQDGGIFISRDQGLSWTRTNQPPSWQIYNAIAVDPTDPTGNTAVFAESFISGGAPHYWKTTNGNDWVDSGVANYGIYDIAYNSEGSVFATGLFSGPQVYFSPNGDAGTWANMHALNTTTNIADGLLPHPTDPNVLFAGSNDGTSTGPGTGGNIGGSVYMTTNAKALAQSVWTDITGDLPNPSGIAAIAFDPDYGEKGALIVALDGSGVFMLDMNDTTPVELEGVEFE